MRARTSETEWYFTALFRAELCLETTTTVAAQKTFRVRTHVIRMRKYCLYTDARTFALHGAVVSWHVFDASAIRYKRFFSNPSTQLQSNTAHRRLGCSSLILIVHPNDVSNVWTRSAHTTAIAHPSSRHPWRALTLYAFPGLGICFFFFSPFQSVCVFLSLNLPAGVVAVVAVRAWILIVLSNGRDTNTYTLPSTSKAYSIYVFYVFMRCT